LTPTPRAAARAERRDRSRAATRSAVLTVALPSMASLGVFAAVAANTTHPPLPRQATPPPPTRPAPTGPLGSLPRGVEEFADRAGRAQTRIDLAKRQQADRRRQEDARPKVVLPVTAHGLSATFGEAGTHWSARHTGIDFPVPRGTQVRAVTDGTVGTQWNPAYGYMARVTAPDGTQTWYCHLGSYRIRRGQVRAGDVIAYSGNSGNSTGPHLHFEVRPAGADPIDPLPWLLAHGLDPR